MTTEHPIEPSPCMERRVHWVPLVVTGVAVVGFLFFVYGYPRVFPRIEASHPNNYAANVDNALEAGDVVRAVKIARHAANWHRLDPMAQTVYARALLRAGDKTAALSHLERAIRLRKEPPPSYRPTRKPLYFAPARVIRGSLEVQQGNLVAGVHEFEFARAFADVTAPQFAPFQTTMYDTYAACGMWARALELGTPPDNAWGELDHRGLLRFAMVCEGLEEWDLATEAARALHARETTRAYACYLIGRSALADDDMPGAVEALRQAMDHGHPDAAFFLGQALARTGDSDGARAAFLETPGESLYRLFALARAVDMPAGPEATPLVQELDTLLARPLPLRAPGAFRAYGKFVLHSADVDVAYLEAGTKFPVLLSWMERKRRVPDGASAQFREDSDGTLVVSKGRRLFQLKWVRNEVCWSGVESLPVGETVIPGWSDTARDWYGLRDGPASRVAEDRDGNRYLEVSNDDIHKMAWLVSVPEQVQPRRSYLLAGRVRTAETEACLGWRCLNRQENVEFEEKVFDQSMAPEWTWQAGWSEENLRHDTLIVEFGVIRHEGTACFDDVLLVGLEEPSTGT